jgi:hypothetical protein
VIFVSTVRVMCERRTDHKVAKEASGRNEVETPPRSENVRRASLADDALASLLFAACHEIQNVSIIVLD